MATACTDPQDYHQAQHRTYSRQRRRPNINIKNNKPKSPSSCSTKSNLSNDRKRSSSIINFRNSQHKPFKHLSYTYSEEGQVEQFHTHIYILDDKKYHAKHYQSYENFSCQCQIYGEKT